MGPPYPKGGEQCGPNGSDADLPVMREYNWPRRPGCAGSTRPSSAGVGAASGRDNRGSACESIPPETPRYKNRRDQPRGTTRCSWDNSPRPGAGEKLSLLPAEVVKVGPCQTLDKLDVPR